MRSVEMVAQLEDFRSAMDEDDVRQFSSDYFIPLDVSEDGLQCQCPTYRMAMVR